VPTIPTIRRVKMVGTLRFAHSTAPRRMRADALEK